MCELTKQRMNLVIDFGNTATKLALFRGSELIEVWDERGQTLERLPDILSTYPIAKAIVATVVDLLPEINDRLTALPFPLLRLDKQTPLPISNLYKTPETLGYDRIAAVVGAVAAAPGHNLLVIDAGTAITYEFVDASGCYHGGNISPGVHLRFKALHQYTSRLPLVEAEGDVLSFGNDTETAIRSGVLNGVEYEIRGYVSAFQKKYPDLLIFLTGGSQIFFEGKLKKCIFADRFLVLKGLNCILEYNSCNGGLPTV